MSKQVSKYNNNSRKKGNIIQLEGVQHFVNRAMLHFVIKYMLYKGYKVASVICSRVVMKNSIRYEYVYTIYYIGVVFATGCRSVSKMST